MAESVLDVLMYLFETSGDEEAPNADRDELRQELERAGFRNRSIERALDWLDGLALRREAAGDEAPTERSIRVFNREECARLDAESRGYLMYLEQIGILTPTHRELVLDRLMALDAEEIEIEDIKWVVLMVLFSQPGEEAAYARMEDLVFEERAALAH